MMNDCNSDRIVANDSVCLSFRQKARRLFHWAPLAALFIIFFITATGTNAISHIMHPFDSVYNFLHFLLYVYEFYLIMNNYLTASFLGPGFVPYGWKPEKEADKQFLQYCELCESYKPPRAHHCRKCDRCVMKMDHHCPWINSCCGHLNHGFFVYFLFFAPIGCLHSTVVLVSTLYHAIYLDYYLAAETGAIVVLSLMEFLCTFFACGLAVGVVIAVGALFVVQVRAVARAETGVETWIREKAEMRERGEEEAAFVYPYDRGRWANLLFVLSWSGRCTGDGVHWPLRDGCDQYDLTREQIQQKRDKARHSQVYEAVRPYSGSLLPLATVGLRAVLGAPCTDENRLPLRPGQLLAVTRWKRHWLYGQAVTMVTSGRGEGDRPIRPRGWFPLACARPHRDGCKDE